MFGLGRMRKLWKYSNCPHPVREFSF